MLMFTSLSTYIPKDMLYNKEIKNDKRTVSLFIFITNKRRSFNIYLFYVTIGWLH